MRRLYLLILVVAVAETAWALFSAETNVNLFLFYAGLVAASALFFVPKITDKSGSSA